MDRPGLADFLRARREALRPTDVGLPEGPRRRTPGLRREEVAARTGMSTDYLARLEQRRGPQPSEAMLTALARALHLSLDERDHLFRLAGHRPPPRGHRSDHVPPAVLRILDRLEDTPAIVVSELGEALVQNRLARALVGDESGFTGLRRSQYYRWFAEPETERALYPTEDHARQSRTLAAALRAALGSETSGRDARAIAERLAALSPEFVEIWAAHEVGVLPSRHKTLLHPELGPVEVDCQFLHTENHAQSLLLFTAAPGSPSDDKLRLLDTVATTRRG
ncbi:helix-turn-helix transcriptional regulator [Cellulomonas soli]|uniref:helix-turn-helix transcriptional regulator n=1 Tax=Cellulomonas soli TaxID=931535 RepID=UPI003F84156C